MTDRAAHLQYRPEAFVRMRLDEAEADARAVLEANRQSRRRGMGSTLWDEQDAQAEADLADIAAKRRILDIVQEDLDAGAGPFCTPEVMRRWGKAYLIACALAEPYAGHEDYSHKWVREGTTP